jgi:hypothetical protein
MRSSDGVLSESEGREAGAIQVSLHRRREGVDLGGRVIMEEVTHAALGLTPQLAPATYPDASPLISLNMAFYLSSCVSSMSLAIELAA